MGAARGEKLAKQSADRIEVKEQQVQLAAGEHVTSFHSGKLAIGSCPTTIPPPLHRTFHGSANCVHGRWACMSCAQHRDKELVRAAAAAAGATTATSPCPSGQAPGTHVPLVK